MICENSLYNNIMSFFLYFFFVMYENLEKISDSIEFIYKLNKIYILYFLVEFFL